jgi:hypothetical protein
MYSNIGAALLRSGKVATAVEAFHAALSWCPSSVEAGFNLAVALVGETPPKLEEALTAFRNAADADFDCTVRDIRYGIVEVRHVFLLLSIPLRPSAFPDPSNPPSITLLPSHTHSLSLSLSLSLPHTHSDPLLCSVLSPLTHPLILVTWHLVRVTCLHQVLCRQQRWSDAEAECTRRLQEMPGDAALLTWLAHCQLRDNRSTAAVDTCRTALAAGGGDAVRVLLAASLCEAAVAAEAEARVATVAVVARGTAADVSRAVGPAIFWRFASVSRLVLCTVARRTRCHERGRRTRRRRRLSLLRRRNCSTSRACVCVWVTLTLLTARVRHSSLWSRATHWVY